MSYVSKPQFYHKDIINGDYCFVVKLKRTKDSYPEHYPKGPGCWIGIIFANDSSGLAKKAAEKAYEELAHAKNFVDLRVWADKNNKMVYYCQ